MNMLKITIGHRPISIRENRPEPRKAAWRTISLRDPIIRKAIIEAARTARIMGRAASEYSDRLFFGVLTKKIAPFPRFVQYESGILAGAIIDRTRAKPLWGEQ